jgi:hypothetical protein
VALVAWGRRWANGCVLCLNKDSRAATGDRGRLWKRMSDEKSQVPKKATKLTIPDTESCIAGDGAAARGVICLSWPERAGLRPSG